MKSGQAQILLVMLFYGAVVAVLLPALAAARGTVWGVVALGALAFVFPGSALVVIVDKFSSKWFARLIRWHLAICVLVSVVALVWWLGSRFGAVR